MIVMKFGGTSVESAEAIRRVAAIVRARLDRKPVVVVSAMGKTTNKLLAMAAEAAAGRRARALEQLEDLQRFHLNEARDLIGDGRQGEVLDLVQALFSELAEILKGLAVLRELTHRMIDAISAYGERLSSAIVARGFGALGMDTAHVDAREVIITDACHTRAAPLLPQTYERLARTVGPLADRQVVVMGGFIGSTEDGITTTLGRGGSDYSASLVGVGIGAEEIQIWTDVDGILTCDPNLIPNAHRVKKISYSEAAELAYFGAKVLHPATMRPAMEKQVSVRVLNSRRPEILGTEIVPQAVPCSNAVKALSCKRNITVVTVHSTRMLNAYGFLHRMFEAFDRHETSVDMLATSEVSVSLTVDNSANLNGVCEELKQFSSVTVENGQAIVCLVGDNIRYTPGVAGRAFKALEKINVRMISQGASLLNLSFVVADEDLSAAMALLHEEFFRDLDPEVFERR